MKKIYSCLVIFLVLLPSACRPAASGIATAQVSTALPVLPGTVFPIESPPPPTLLPTLPSALSPTELKYLVLDQFPDFFFCDPDYYPIARANELDLALQRFAELQANREEFQVILKHNNLGGLTQFSDDQKLLMYREHKKLAALYFELAADKYGFQLQTGSEGQAGEVIKGTIDALGSIDVLERTPGFPTCPICLALHTQIDTPLGAIAVEELTAGEVVWTMNESGERVPAKISKTVRVSVPIGHHMIRLVLMDGRELEASPGHPTADGRRIGDLKAGDLLDGTLVSSVQTIPYLASATYDLLPAGETGFYWANGVLLGSTLRQYAATGYLIEQ